METKIIAIIIDTFDYGENDKIVQTFSKELGFITFYAKGVRKQTSKNKFSLEKFSISEFEIFLSYNKMSKLKRGKLIYSSMFITNNYEIYLFILFIICILENFWTRNFHQKMSYLFNLYKKIIYILSCEKNKNKWISSIIFVLYKLLEFVGSKLNLSNCYRCLNGKIISTFSFKKYGFICKNCILKKDFILEKEFLKLIYNLNYIEDFDKGINYIEKINKNNQFLLLYFLIDYYSNNIKINYYVIDEILKTNLFLKMKEKFESKGKKSEK